jgi:hypothetical protein
MKKRCYAFLALPVLLIFACNLPSLTATHQNATQKAATDQQFGASATALAQEATATAFMQGADATALAQSANATGTVMSLNAIATAQAANATAQAGSANATSLALAASATALARASTETAQAHPATLPPLSQSPLPPPGTMIRISFPSGATSANLSGLLQKSYAVDYSLRALQDQTMIVYVSSPGNNVYLGVTGLSDGVPLLRTVAGSTQFSGVLPLTQDYRLTLVSPVQKSTYNMQVIIPVRIKFPTGAISTKEQGKVIAGNVNHYLLKAMTGQTMTVIISSPNNDLFLTIYGMQDGSPLVRSVAGETSWTGVLPGTQDYMIEVVSEGGTTHYTLQVTVQ